MSQRAWLVNATLAAASALGACQGDLYVGREKPATQAADGGIAGSRCPGPLLIPGTAECGGALAARVFRHALVACDGLTAIELTTDSFDSLLDGTAARTDRGASVAIGGHFSQIYPWTLGGSLYLAGNTLGPALSARMEVSEDLWSAGWLDASRADLQVGGDAWFAAGASLSTVSRIVGDVYVPSSQVVEGGMIDGMRKVYEAGLPPLSGCAASDLLPIARWVDRARVDNDNKVLGVDLSNLGDATAPRTVELGCGRLFARGLAIPQNLTLRVTGQVQIFVAEDLVSFGDIRIELGPDATLDLFIDGAFDVDRWIAPPSAAMRVRIYTTHDQSIVLDQEEPFVASLYAPSADLVIVTEKEVYGALMVAGLTGTRSVQLHYDRALLRAGETCTQAPGAICTGAFQCAPDLACNDSLCSACSVDPSCGVGFRCDGGRCLTLSP